MKKLLRLFVMTQIKHDESYYQSMLKDSDIDFKNLSHREVALWKASVKQIEADILIETAFQKGKTKITDFDYKAFFKNECYKTNEPCKHNCDGLCKESC